MSILRNSGVFKAILAIDANSCDPSLAHMSSADFCRMFLKQKHDIYGAFAQVIFHPKWWRDMLRFLEIEHLESSMMAWYVDVGDQAFWSPYLRPDLPIDFKVTSSLSKTWMLEKQGSLHCALHYDLKSPTCRSCRSTCRGREMLGAEFKVLFLSLVVLLIW